MLRSRIFTAFGLALILASTGLAAVGLPGIALGLLAVVVFGGLITAFVAWRNRR